MLCQYIIYIYIYIWKKSTNGRLKKKTIATVPLGTIATVKNLKKKKEKKKKKRQSGSINQNGIVEALPLFI